MPERYGPWTSLHIRFRRWSADGTFGLMLRAAQTEADATGDVDWPVSADSTIVRTHQHAAGARKGVPKPCARPVQRRADQQIHPVCDAVGRPLAFVLNGGNTNDCTRFSAVTGAIRVPGPARSMPSSARAASWAASGGLRRVSHEGYEWLCLLYGRLWLTLGDQDLVLTAGEVIEFDTRTPHGGAYAGSMGRSIIRSCSGLKENVYGRAPSQPPVMAPLSPDDAVVSNIKLIPGRKPGTS